MSKLSKFRMDLTPLRKYPDFRSLWASGMVSNLGSMITYVAVPFQIKNLTHSYLAVALSAAVEIIPLVIFGLYGGVLADAVDRKKMIWAAEAGAMALSATLFINSQLAHPSLLLIYIVAAAFAAVDGLQRPSMDAILPRLVGHDDLPSASALLSLRMQMAIIVGPAIGGIIISTFSVGTGYAVDVTSFLISLIFLSRVKNVPPHESAEKPSLAGLWLGISYAFGRQDLLGTYLVDLAAMFFAMPNALFPFWVDQLHAPWALGLLYGAGTVGAFFVTITSGWVKHYRFHGRAIALAAVGWGIAITLSGLVHSIYLVIFCLALAGAADHVSVLFRAAIWNQTIPDEIRGRLAGIQLLSYSIGPLAGQLRAATMASATTLAISVTSGGVMCIIVVLLLTSWLVKFRKYDVESNEFAIAQRKIRAERENI